jgi:hypothetical protein
MKLLIIILVCATLQYAMASGANQNMNGEYAVASGARQNVNFNTDYASKGHEYFDVWAPDIATHYGDVFWTDQGSLHLPSDIVERFAGKVIAITGYEQDQVMVQPQGSPGLNPDQDVSVPINWAYNHHYMAWMIGKYATFVNINLEDDTDIEYDPQDIWYNHGLATKWIAKELPGAELRSNPSIPVSQMFSEGNGGESRKSFHGYPDGYAQLIESPQTWHVIPMQIDTRNRACGATIADVNHSNCTTFVPGLEPLQARYGRGIPPGGTNVSGILECPCNGKFGGDPLFYGANTKTKNVVHNFVTLQSPQCTTGEEILSPIDCFNAIASNLGFLPNTNSNTKIVNLTVNDHVLIPVGCSVRNGDNVNENKNENENENEIDSPNIYYAYYNTAETSEKKCSASHLMYGNTISVPGNATVNISLSMDTTAGNVTFLRSPPGEWCSDNHNNVLAKFPASSNSNADALVALNKCESFCRTSQTCEVCSVDCSLSNSNTGQCQWNALPQCGTVKTYNGPNGFITGDISRKTRGLVNITISGPSNVWFGVGFNARAMEDSPYTLVVNSSGVIEQKIGTCGSEAEHCPGTLLNKTIKLLSNTVLDGVRTVVIQRDLIGQTPDYYSFIPSETGTINLITAVGSSQTFEYHIAHALTIISLISGSGGHTCVCDTGANGQICEYDGTQCNQFVKNCIASPAGSLLAQNNPTCNSRQYSGGLSCCIHKHNLLDVDQEIPPQLLRYHLKFRFWFQEYTPETESQPPSHYNLPRIYQQTEANAGEYDVPPAFALANLTIVGYPGWPLNQTTPGTTCTGDCPNGADCDCIHTIHYRWIESASKPMRLIYAGGHCHAPSCISLVLHRNDTGEVLCEQIPVYGRGNISSDKYDESGYLALPPCLWGNDTGLNPSVLLPAGTPLLAIKKNHNTHMGHFGEMASWQMRGVYF